MKLLVIGCVLVSAFSQNLESQGPNQYFERTPNSNLVQIKYTGVQGRGLNENSQSSNSYGNNQRASQVSQGGNQAFINQRLQNEFNSQDQRLSQQNQRNSKSSQSFYQENQIDNQQNPVAQFSRQNRGIGGQLEPFSFNNYKFANPQLVDISFDATRQQQFNQNQERQSQQQNQRANFPSQQSQRQQEIVQQQLAQRQEQQQLAQRQQRQKNFVQKQQQQQLARRQQQQFVERQQQQQQLAQRQQPLFVERQQPQSPQRGESSVVLRGSQQQRPRPSGINPFQNPGIQSFQKEFQQGQGFQQNQLRLISGHLQRVDSDEILGIFQPFSIPASASLYEGTVNSQFSCSNQGQGFFADPSNNYQQFHVCTRVQGRNVPDLYRFTFQCVDGEYFDQVALTCVRRPAGVKHQGFPCSFGAYNPTPYIVGTTPPGLSYIANKQHFVTGIRRK